MSGGLAVRVHHVMTTASVLRHDQATRWRRCSGPHARGRARALREHLEGDGSEVLRTTVDLCQLF